MSDFRCALLPVKPNLVFVRECAASSDICKNQVMGAAIANIMSDVIASIEFLPRSYLPITSWPRKCVSAR